jgi:hypothetical protein
MTCDPEYPRYRQAIRDVRSWPHPDIVRVTVEPDLNGLQVDALVTVGCVSVRVRSLAGLERWVIWGYLELAEDMAVRELEAMKDRLEEEQWNLRWTTTDSLESSPTLRRAARKFNLAIRAYQRKEAGVE